VWDDIIKQLRNAQTITLALPDRDPGHYAGRDLRSDYMSVISHFTYGMASSNSEQHASEPLVLAVKAKTLPSGAGREIKMTKDALSSDCHWVTSLPHSGLIELVRVLTTDEFNVLRENTTNHYYFNDVTPESAGVQVGSWATLEWVKGGWQQTGGISSAPENSSQGS
jgi:hypothetical protein